MDTYRAMIAAPLAALLLAGEARAAEPAAAPPPPATAAEVQTLRAQVEQLTRELEALKARPVPATLAPPPAPGAVATTPVQVTDLQERLDLLEVQQKDAVVAGDIPGSFRVPGTEISLRLYGFAELNWVHVFGPDNSDIDYATFPPYLPLDGTPEGRRDNRDYLTARTSRIGVEAGAPTRFGVLGVKIEGDFNNEPRAGGSVGSTAQNGSVDTIFTQQITSSYGFRIRHAYGVFGGLLVGQTWSTFMDVDNYPETVDFNGPTGATFIRQPLIRYSYPTRTWGTFTAAVENSVGYVLDGRGELPGDPDPVENEGLGLPLPSQLARFPDVVVRWDKGFEWGALSARAVSHELRFDDGELDEAKRGWGAAVSASFKVRETGWLALQLTGGDGIGRYLNYVEGALYDGQAIRLERAAGAIAGYQHKPADWVRINFVYGGTYTFDDDYTDAAKAAGLDAGRFGVNRWVQQAHVGPIFTPVPGFDFGVEGIWAQRKTLAGEKGDDLRLNVSFKYYIN